MHGVIVELFANLVCIICAKIVTTSKLLLKVKTDFWASTYTKFYSLKVPNAFYRLNYWVRNGQVHLVRSRTFYLFNSSSPQAPKTDVPNIDYKARW